MRIYWSYFVWWNVRMSGSLSHSSLPPSPSPSLSLSPLPIFLLSPSPSHFTHIHTPVGYKNISPVECAAMDLQFSHQRTCPHWLNTDKLSTWQGIDDESWLLWREKTSRKLLIHCPSWPRDSVFSFICTHGSILCYTRIMRWNVIFHLFLPACNLGTVQRENLVPVSYCRATEELQNGGWIMGIHPGEPKCATFCARYFFECLWIACTKTFTAELMDVSGLWDFNKKKGEELLYLLVFVWSPRSEGWPR